MPGLKSAYVYLLLVQVRFNPRYVIRILFQVVVRSKLKADSPGAGHLVFGMKLHPLSASADGRHFRPDKG